MMQIKALSQKYNIKEDTIRYYEKIGLLQPIRSKNGYRQYNEQCVNQLKMIVVLKQLGFSLGEIAKLIILEQQEITTECNDSAVSLFEQKIKQLTYKLAFYQQAIQTLQDTKKLMEEEQYLANQKEMKQAIETLFNTLRRNDQHG